MKSRSAYAILIAIFGLLTISAAAQPSGPENVIPAPASYTIREGSYTLPSLPNFYLAGAGSEQLASYLRGCELGFGSLTSKRAADVRINIGDKAFSDKSDEAFSMDISPKVINISAKTSAGAFYALQALLQMSNVSREIASCTITDAPRYSYRGVLIDISRHFRSMDFLKKQIDALALVRINTIHLHLTDDAGWRIEIDAYPRLTDYAAWRDGETWKDWASRGYRYVERDHPYASGGYLTKDDARELIAYAASRHITLVPEIEMPGHSKEVIAAFPELECQGVASHPASSDVCPGNEATYKFYETVIDEIIDLFPSQYIHVGGDEASKRSWAGCPVCRERMESEGLESVDRLQNYLIARIGRHIDSLGRRMIGWDEIIDGGLAPGATVMSWHDSGPGLEAMKLGHDVIMSPSTNLYIDYYQDAPFYEPDAYGHVNSLERVWSYDPDKMAATPGCTGNLIGVQANLWSEFIPEDAHYEYMLYPRIFALAEIGWGKRPDAEYSEFRARAHTLGDYLRSRGYNAFDLAKEVGERPERAIPVNHLGIGCPVKALQGQYSSEYTAGGEMGLTDGLRGGWAFRDGRWQGYNCDIDLVVDLGCEKEIHYIATTFMCQPWAWIGQPDGVEFYISKDGENYEKLALQRPQATGIGPHYLPYGVAVDGSARYVRIKAWRANKPQNDWLFLDEIVIK